MAYTWGNEDGKDYWGMLSYPTSMPYDRVNVIDQSEYVDEVDVTPIDTTPSGPIAYIPFISERGYGEDNKLTYMDASILAKYGKPNFKKYGLSLYLANRFVAGGGTVLGKRVVASNATCSNRLVYAKVTKNASNKDSSGNYYFNFEEFSSSEGIVYNKNGIPNKSAMNVTTAGTGMMDGPPPYSLDGFGGTRYMFADAQANSLRKFASFKSIGKSQSDPEIEYTIQFPTSGVPLYNSEIPENGIIAVSTQTNKFAMNEIGETFLAVTVTKGSDPAANYWLWIGAIATINSVDVGINAGYINGLKNNKITSEDILLSISNNEGADISENAIIENPDATITAGNTYFYPLFTIKSKGHGNFTNAFKFNIAADNDMNELILDSNNPNAFLYNIITTDSYNSNPLEKTLTFTFNPDYIYNRESMYVEDVFADYANHLDFIVRPGFDAYKALVGSVIDYTNNIKNPYTNNRILWLNDFDYLFGTNLTEYGFVYNSTIDLSTDLFLSGGSDGSFGNVTDYHFPEDGDNYADPFESALATAYGADDDGESLIWDNYRYPFEYVYAPSFGATMLSAIHNLVIKRQITHARFFTPKFDTYSDVREWIEDNDMSEYTSFKEIRESEWYLIKDPYTYKNLYVPNVYMHAYYEPQHWINAKGRPYAGIANYKISDFKVGSVVPCSASPEEYIANHKIGLNTVIENGNGYAVPYEQITGQQAGVTSALSEINNVYVLTNMIRIALNMAQAKRWDIAFNVDDYRAAIEQEISNNLSGCYESLVVYTKQESANGAGKNRIYCKLNIVFNRILKGITYDFYILLNQE